MSAPVRHGERIAAFGKRLVIAAVSLASLGLAVTCVVTWIPVWPCALFEHLRVQYVECGLIVVAAAGALRLRGYFDVALIASLLNGLPIASDLTASPREVPQDGTRVRVLVLNVHTESKSYEQVRRLIADENPDLVGLVEVDQRWIDALAPALTGYGGRIEARVPTTLALRCTSEGKSKDPLKTSQLRSPPWSQRSTSPTRRST